MSNDRYTDPDIGPNTSAVSVNRWVPVVDIITSDAVGLGERITALSLFNEVELVTVVDHFGLCW